MGKYSFNNFPTFSIGKFNLKTAKSKRERKKYVFIFTFHFVAFGVLMTSIICMHIEIIATMLRKEG